MTTRRKSKNKRVTYWYPGKDQSPEEYSIQIANSRRQNEWRQVLWNMPFGTLRRQCILNLLSPPGESLAVNRRWCVILDRDPDLQRLVKQGKLVRKRCGSHRTKTTYLVTPSNH